MFFRTDREEPGGVNKHSTFRDAQRAHYNRNHFVILESENGALTVRKLVYSTQNIGENLVMRSNAPGETERAMRTRFMEHKRRSSVNSEVSKHIHQDHKDHSVTLDKTKILSVDHR